MNFAEYYRGQFRSDLDRFLMSIPTESRHHEPDGSIVTIQLDRLTMNMPHLLEIAEERRAHFAVALYWMILVDQVCYTHFDPIYRRFQRLTNYPKLIGNCPGGCRYHLHPREVFAAMNRGRRGASAKETTDRIGAVLHESIPVMLAEVIGFLEEQFPHIDLSAFWDRCTDELPSGMGTGMGTSGA